MKDYQKKVLSKIDAMQEDIFDLVRQLVNIPSISPNYPGVDKEEGIGGETQCNRKLSEYYHEIGLRTELWDVESQRENLVGVLKGAGGGKSLIFNGHIDTVPPSNIEEWKFNDPFSGNIENGKLYGLGACDMKGGIVAQFAAAKALVDCGVKLEGDLILESVVGEETMDHEAGTTGTIKRGYKADGAIVSEPTSRPGGITVAPVSPGLLFLKVTCPGLATHPGARFEFVRAGGAGSNAGVNAIEKGVLILSALQQLEREWGFSKRHDLFPPGFFTLHPGVIVGGPPGPLVPYIVSTYCRIEYIIWYPPQGNVEDVKAEISDYIVKAAALDPWLEKNPPVLEWVNHWPPYELERDHELVRVCCDSHRGASAGPVEAGNTGTEIQGFFAVCDATWFNLNGIPAITYGPGSGMVAHRCDEYVPTEELILTAKTYALSAMEWCGVAHR